MHLRRRGPESKVAVVTGGNRGIGFEICRRLAAEGVTVVLTARSEAEGRAACETLAGEGLDVRFHRLDVTDEAGIQSLAARLREEFDGLDILINNAAINNDDGAPGTKVSLDAVRAAMETNVYGPLRLCQVLAPLMKERGGGRIVNVSSRMGATDRIEAGHLSYRISKAALNALTLVLASELRGSRIRVNAAHPGWVRTGMGGRSAPRSAEEGADTAVWLALEAGGETGKFFYDRKVIPW